MDINKIKIHFCLVPTPKQSHR